MTEALAVEMDRVMLMAKQSSIIGVRDKSIDKEDERVIMLCDYISVKYYFLDKLQNGYKINGLGIIEMEVNNDLPFAEMLFKEKKEKYNYLKVKVWEVTLAIIGGGAVLEAVKWFFRKFF